MEVFVDGSYCPKTKKSGVGIHAVHGLNVSMSVRAKTSLEAEFMAVLIGLEFVNYGGTIYTDCTVVVKSFLNKRLIVRHEKWSELIIKGLTEKKVKLYWIKREKNKIADALARQGRKESTLRLN